MLQSSSPPITNNDQPSSSSISTSSSSISTDNDDQKVVENDQQQQEQLKSISESETSSIIITSKNMSNYYYDNFISIMWPSIVDIVNFSYENFHYFLTRTLTFFSPSSTTINDYLPVGNNNSDNKSYNNYTMIINNLFVDPSIATLTVFMFRMETIFTIIILFILSSFIIHHHHRRNVIQSPSPSPSQTTTTAQSLNQNHSPTTTMTFSFKNFLSKLFHYLNVTILFGYLFTAVDSTIRSYFEQQQTVVNQFHSGQAGAYSMQGRRHNMEDCFSIHNNIGHELGIEYYAVFDGHGGPNAALYADKEIFDSIVKRIKNHVYKNNDNDDDKLPLQSCTMNASLARNSDKNTCAKNNRFETLTMSTMKTILNDEVIEVDKRLLETFQRRSDISGSTALIAIRLLHTNKLLVANVGDSRGILCDSKGATIPLSFDHKPYQLKEYRRILEAGGYISLKGVYRVNGILAISRALGDYPLKDNRLIIPDPDILSFDLRELKPKFMIMASDGFWDTFTNEQAVQFVNNELSKYHDRSSYDSNDILSSSSQSSIALAIAKKLAKESYNRESYDNITVIVVLFDENYDVCSKDSVSLSSSSSLIKKSSPIKKKSSSNQQESSSSKPAIHEES